MKIRTRPKPSVRFATLFLPLAAIGAALGVLTPPVIYTPASPEEIRAAVDPWLLERRKELPPEANAYPLYEKATAQLVDSHLTDTRFHWFVETATPLTVKERRETVRLLEKNRLALASAKKAVEVSGLQAPVSDFGQAEPARPDKLAQLAALQAVIDAKDGNAEGVRDNWRFLVRLCNHWEGVDGHLHHAALGAQAVIYAGHAFAALRREGCLPPRDLSWTLRNLTPASKDDPAQRVAVRNHFQLTYKLIDRDDKMKPTELHLFDFLNLGGHTEGRYEPVETVRLLSAQCVESRDNLALPFDKQSHQVGDTIRALTTSIPPQVGTQESLLAYMQRIQRRIAMKRIKNSCGIEFLANMAYFDDARLSRTARTTREAIRLLAALALYKERTGGRADSIQTLLKRDLLPDAPKDFFSDQPLRYDSQRQIVWSVGTNGIDEDGQPGVFGTAPDFVWSCG